MNTQTPGRPFVLCHNNRVPTIVPQASNQDTYRQENANLCAIYPVVNSRGKSSGGAPSADAVSDTTERLEVVPVRELVFFRGGRHVRADDADGKVGNFGDGDLGAVKLWQSLSADFQKVGEVESNLP